MMLISLWIVAVAVWLRGSCSQIIQTTNGSVLLNTIELMGLQGFKGERHNVTTKDGYKLVLFRIPPTKSPAPVVYLQHGLSLTSDVFVMEKNALAFELSRQGFDVWIGNIRGNYYSHNHEKLASNDSKFWDFSYHEMGYCDIPAFIDYILATTKQPSLYYIGHSLGSTIFFVMTSTKPEYNKKIKAMFSLAPVAFFTGKMAMFMKQPLYVQMSKNTTDKWIQEDKFEVFPRKEWIQGSHQVFCTDVPENFQSMCLTLLEMFVDIVGGEYFPAGLSLKTLLHFRQNILTDSFRQYDYDSEAANQQVYKAPVPPAYDLKQITARVYLIYGPDDVLVDENDVKMLKGNLSNVVEVYKVPDPKFGHTDYIFVYKDEDEDEKEDRTHFRLEMNKKIVTWLEENEKM